MDTLPEDEWTRVVERGLTLDVEARLPAGFAERIAHEIEVEGGAEQQDEPSIAGWWMGMTALAIGLVSAHVLVALPQYATLLAQAAALAASMRLDLIAAAATALLGTEAVARYLGRSSPYG